ncbi:MAG TPA: hypothetical protein VK138_10710 [Acidiferrobacterales bacterium]|nr:hypothetical protein [Acidiferrobacterales bacterium]
MKSIALLVGSIVFFTLILSTGCGSNYGAPDGSTITINPTSYSLLNISATSTTSTIPVIVTVRNKNGVPIPGVVIFISVPTIFLINGFGPVGFIDQNGNAVTGTQFMAQTDDNGVYSFRFQYVSGGGANYFGDMVVSSNSAYTTMRFTITP